MENFTELTNEQVWSLFGLAKKELKSRGLVRTGNIIGERGEQLVFKHYNGTRGLPKLQPSQITSKNVDAMDRDGRRYSIKTLSEKTVNTGKFVVSDNDQKFERLVVISLDEKLDTKIIIELTWDQFVKHRSFDGKSWFITLNQRLIKEADLIYLAAHISSPLDWRKY